ncbi:hypothetical protein Ga0466249_004319 [Sporomusaceae bacterium BoRhaA]|uniref:hypothetical protein n=1 Tax=Pelorhabdus rhamnosifermentans TaxID=2772457 RepID=UPI001C062BA0|nr:hypothetical protein [Pelorhabdus rhamnosifermentans]MBU2703183.1 hypothetical protein [Pelorhabdus rhamnosifermentans]
MKNKKNYVCHADICRFNNEGSCNKNLDCVTIAVYDGVAQCPNFEEKRQYDFLDNRQKAFAAALLAEVKSILEDIGEELEEDLSQFELYTDKDSVCYMCPKDGKYSQDFANDERIACLVDAYNTVINGKPLHCNFTD